MPVPIAELKQAIKERGLKGDFLLLAKCIVALNEHLKEDAARILRIEKHLGLPRELSIPERGS